ncbi:hypothetical protein LZ554_002265 [Drepanopeziza brunnea f. sp. 'monogermtubi']|nr:hypothetical protein LZ554_002265 [Drepanopeziza brunnea f. sp. 'monogermtubi']
MPRNRNRYTQKQEKEHLYLPRDNEVNHHTSEGRKQRFSPPPKPKPKPEPEPDFTMAGSTREVAITDDMIAASDNVENMLLAQRLFKENLLFENQRLKDNLDLHKEKLIFENNTIKETCAEIFRILREERMAASQASKDNFVDGLERTSRKILFLMILGTICVIFLMSTFLVLCLVMISRFHSTQ